MFRASYCNKTVIQADSKYGSIVKIMYRCKAALDAAPPFDLTIDTDVASFKRSNSSGYSHVFP